MLDRPWPDIMHHEDCVRERKPYSSRFPGYYMSGDGAKRDKGGLPQSNII